MATFVSRRKPAAAATRPNRMAVALAQGLSDRSTINSNIVFAPLRPASDIKYTRELQFWYDYLELFPGSNPRILETLKHYVEALWIVAKANPKARASPDTIRNRVRAFCSAWERENHVRIDAAVKLSMAPYIQGELKAKLGAVESHKKPTFLTIKNYVHLQEFLWLVDYHDHPHDGYRADNSNLLNTHCFTSARLQEVCQAMYEDIEFMVSLTDGKPEFKLGFKRRVCKGRDRKQPEHPVAEIMLGPDGMPPPLYAQPILHWLANIVSSGVLQDKYSLEALLELRPPEGEDFWLLPWSAEMKRTPVFPTWTEHGALDKCRSPTAWGKQAADWARRAGLVDGLGLHAPRREALILVNDSGASLGQVLKFAAQKNASVLLHRYLHDMSTVDGSANFLGTTPRSDLTQDFRSATMRRNAQLPQTLPCAELDALRCQLDYVALTQAIEQLGGTAGGTAADAATQRKKLYAQRHVIEKRALRAFQDSTVHVYPTPPPEHEQSDWRRDHRAHISHLTPELARLARLMPLRVPLRSPEGLAVLRDLIALRTNDCSVAYQAPLRPVDGCCPVPTCRQVMLNTWLSDQGAWRDHCHKHLAVLADVPFLCNPVVLRTAIACAGYCPCCLQNEGKPPETRMHQFLSRPSWQRHVLACLHPRCPKVVSDGQQLWPHLNDVHSIPAPSVGKRKRSESCDASMDGDTCCKREKCS